MSRIKAKFADLSAKNCTAFVPFIMAGDPDYSTSLALLKQLPAAGADIIELGVAFTDPMADGPAIQAAGLRALKAGQTLRKTLDMVRAFRQQDETTPIILMGYYNPFYSYGIEKFLTDANGAGVDGLIIVDLPPEEDSEMCLPARAHDIDFIRLATPTTDHDRLPDVIKNTSGFVYYVSVAGITGRGVGASTVASDACKRLRSSSGLPVAIGFGIKTAEKAREFAKFADAVVVGSALVEDLANGLEADAASTDNAVNAVLTRTRDIAAAVKSARQE